MRAQGKSILGCSLSLIHIQLIIIARLTSHVCVAVVIAAAVVLVSLFVYCFSELSCCSRKQSKLLSMVYKLDSGDIYIYIKHRG